MRLVFAAVVPALLLLSGEQGWAMGSGPHPHLLNELPPAAPSSSPAVDSGGEGLTTGTAAFGTVVSFGALALLLWAVRQKEKAEPADA